MSIEYIELFLRFRDMSSTNLVYLTSEQALADAAGFIVNIQTKYEIPSTAKWIAFGGSYPGSLAAWLRMKYPHLVYAAVSSSGPLLAKIDFPGMLSIDGKIRSVPYKIFHFIYKSLILFME